MIRMICLLLFSLLITLPASANDRLPIHSPVPGGVAVIPLTGVAMDNAPQVHYQGNRVLVTRYEGQWHAVVGVPLSAKPGAHHIEVQASAPRQFSFTVLPKDYETQRLIVKNQR